MKPDFLNLPSVKVAPKLLGWVLCRKLPQGVVKAAIVETEAYQQADPASHSYKGLTPRTAPMFNAGGTIYVYFTYGMHYGLNIVTGKKGQGEAVLLRAAQPLLGISVMKNNRAVSNVKQLANGPGKLAQAFGILDNSMSGKILNKSSIWLEPPLGNISFSQIMRGPRIGISQAKDKPWRFYIKNNPYVSGYTKI